MENRFEGKRRFRNRIVESGEIEVDQVLFNLDNWRVHPKYQQDVLKAVLEEVGWVGKVIINKTTGNLVDGHLRVQLAAREGELKVPCDYIEVTKEEEEKILATLDPITAMAVTDREKYIELLQRIDTEDERLRQMLDKYSPKKETIKSDVDLIEDMELAAFEGYDYLVLVFKDQLDWIKALDLFEVKKSRVPVNAEGKQKVGLGRVINGKEFLAKYLELESENNNSVNG